MVLHPIPFGIKFRTNMTPGTGSEKWLLGHYLIWILDLLFIFIKYSTLTNQS